MSPRNFILLVDDDPKVIAMVQLRLERAGFDVTSCADAAQAVVQAKALKPWLIVTDVNMPQWGSGVDAYRGIRGIPALRDTPVIFLTAMDPAEAKKVVPQDERTRLLFKPVDWGLLEAVVRELSGRQAAAPAAPPAAPPPPPPQAAPPSRPPASMLRNLILLVDDDPKVIAMLQLRLERAGYDVTSCADAAQAVVQAKGLKPRLIITDIQMPHWGTGVDAYQEIRAVPHFRETPVIFLTAMEPAEAAKLVPDDGRTRLLFKPVAWELLQKALFDLLGEARPL
ncbi:MAG: response regulator [Elusimicrobia bacterium]|nr:response regulator [Elusimicrobiota bacterium]